MRTIRLAVLSLALLCGAPVFAQSADPWAQVTLYRDRWGTPHVYADSLYGLGFGHGYAQAADRLAVIQTAYRIAMGSAAAVWGEEYAESDRFALRMRHGELAAEYLTTGDEVTRALCAGFADGVNAWMRDNPRRVPEWAEPVTAVMPLALLHCYLMSFAPFDLPEVWRRAPAAVSGNAFALAPARTESGKAILAINPHTDYNGPFQWCESHLIFGRMNVYGATLAGLPVILQGHNDRLGWALTPNHPDTGDIYNVSRSAAAAPPANQFNVDRGAPDLSWANFVLLNTRTMYVRNNRGLQAVAVDCLPADMGPVVASFEGKMAAWRVGGYWSLGGVYQLMAMGAAQSLGEFQSAMALRQLPCFHVVYADARGNIMYLYNATVGVKTFAVPDNPVRPKLVAAQEWLHPLDGGNPATAWGPIVPITQLPRTVNPDVGYVQACGNPPWRATDDPRAVRGDAWPAWLVRDADSERAKRMRQLLALGKRSFRDAQVLLYDTVAAAAEAAVPALLAAARAEDAPFARLHPDTPGCIALLDGWTYAADPSSEAMTYFHAWWRSLAALAAPQLRPGVTLADFVRRDTPATRAMLLKAASDAAGAMRSRYQSVNVPWGDVHKLVRGDLALPAPGSYTGESILASGDTPLENGAMPSAYGYAFAMVVEFGERPEAVSILPFGTSDLPDSPHYADQMPLFAEGRYKRTRFAVDEVQRHAVLAQGRTLFLSAPGVTGRAVVYGDGPIEGRADALTAAPHPLPVGLSAFALFLQPKIAYGAAHSLALEFEAPEAVCEPEALPELAIYAYDDVSGWTRLADQIAEPAYRAYYASDDRVRLYALLGPSELRTVEPDKALIPPTDAAPDAPIQTADASGEPTVAELGTYAPLTAPAPTAPAQQGPAMPGAPAGPAPNPLELPFQTLIGKKPLALSEKDAPAPEDLAMQDGAAIDDAAASAASSPPQAPPQAAPAQPVYQIAAAGPGQRGRNLELAAPGVDATLSISARMLIQGRMTVVQQPPLPLPAGMKVYGPIVSGEYSPKPVPLSRVFVLIRVPETAPDFNALKLYVCDAQKGWIEAPSQGANPEVRSFSALDSTLRVYAVLGPASQEPTP